MKVIEGPKNIWFLDIPVGGVFEHERIYYMKISTGNEIVGVGLESGEIYHFDEKDSVTRVRGFFVVE